MKSFLFALLLFPLFSVAQLAGKVVSISDGDTFTLLTPQNQQIKLRLYGIDCPEKAQDFGQVCKQFLGDLIFDKNVQFEDRGLDRYGRTIGLVTIDMINVNEKMIIEGMAWHYKKYDDNPTWAEYERKARDQRKGLWSQSNPTPPWDWRKIKNK